MDIQARREAIELEFIHTLDSAYQLGKEHEGIDLYEQVQSFKQRLSSLGVVIEGEGELPKLPGCFDDREQGLYKLGQQHMRVAGYKQTYSLIGEK